MKRGMVAVVFLLLLTSAASADWWVRYHGTLSENWRAITGETVRGSSEVDVLLCVDTAPWRISIEAPLGNVLYAGQFDQEGRRLQFQAFNNVWSTLLGRGSFNANNTTLNLQGSGTWFPAGTRSWFGQSRFRGAFVDIIWRP